MGAEGGANGESTCVWHPVTWNEISDGLQRCSLLHCNNHGRFLECSIGKK